MAPNRENYLISIATGMIDEKESKIKLTKEDKETIESYRKEIKELEDQGKSAIFYVPDDYD